MSAFAILLFSVCNWLRVAAFLPQIVRAARDRDGCGAISCTSYAMFAAAHGATAFYAVVALGDVHLLIVSVVSMACCLVVIAATAWSRHRLHRASAAKAQSSKHHLPQAGKGRRITLANGPSPAAPQSL